MSSLPRVTESTRERIAREFDDFGPDACMAKITAHLRRDNPEILDMANRCAADVGDAPKAMLGFGMFYRLLVAQAIGGDQLLMSPLPRITPDTRDIIVTEIDEKGPDAFTFEAVEDLERNNPELLQMAHNFALRQSDYVGVMQGFALLYKSLVLEAARERGSLH